MALPCLLSMAGGKGDHVRSNSERGTQRALWEELHQHPGHKHHTPPVEGESFISPNLVLT